MNEFARYMNAVAIWILSGVLLGAYFMQYYYHETPCPLCFLQRLAMISIASGLFLNVWYGIRVNHYAISYFSALFGASVSIRQIALHICPNTVPFGIPVFGLSLYTWAFLVFVSTILGLSVLLFFYRPIETLEPPRKIGWFPASSLWIILLVTFTNVLSTFSVCGLTPCSG